MNNNNNNNNVVTGGGRQTKQLLNIMKNKQDQLIEFYKS